MLERLRALDATGWSGLEGLVAAVFARKLDLSARLESSGSQFGRDVGLFTLDGQPAGVDIEAKRYNDKSALKRRDLLGEIADTALARPETRTWILTATNSVPAATTQAIVALGLRHGIEVLVLDIIPGGAGPLQVLLASEAEATLAWVAAHDAEHLEAWRHGISALRDQPGFVFIERELTDVLVGRYGDARARASAQAWIRQRLGDDRNRKQEFNQRLGRAGKAPMIARPRLEQALREWRGRDGPGMLVLLGGEGDGKTWAALDLLAAEEVATPLLVTANFFDDGGPTSLLAHALERQCGGDYDTWRERLEQAVSWSEDARFLVLIDGLNEAPHFKTGEMLDALLNADLAPFFDIIVTCRTPFWENRVLPAMAYSEGDHAIFEVEVGHFDEIEEWPQARAVLGPAALELPASVEAALRNPRLWSFAFHLKDQLGGLHELTLESLLVEHWRLRRSERTDGGLSDQEFNRMIARSVHRLMQDEDLRAAALDRGALEGLLREMSGPGDYSRDLAQIEDGVFYVSGLAGELQLRGDRVPVALGLMLADDLHVAARGANPAVAVRRAAAALLDDLPANESVEIIMRAAVFALLSLPPRLRTPLPTLLRHWIGWQNREEDFDRALAIAAGRAPEAFLQAIEDHSQDDEVVGDHIGGELVRALLGRRDLQGYAPVVIEATARWMGSLPAHRLPPRAQGLVSVSALEWVETLDEFAALLLAPLPSTAWAAPLAAWAKRRAILDVERPNAHRYDHHLSWLGLVGPGQGGEPLPPVLEPNAMAAWEALLGGGVFARSSVFQELDQNTWATTVDQVEAVGRGEAADTPIFADLYAEEGIAGAESWMQLERALLDTAPEALTSLVRSLVERALTGEVRGGLGQIQRDHALVLGQGALLIASHLIAEGAGQTGGDRQMASVIARAIETALAFAPTGEVPQALAAMAPPVDVGPLDLSAVDLQLGPDLFVLLERAGDGLNAASLALLHVTARVVAPPALRADPRFVALVALAARSGPVWDILALHTTLRAGDGALLAAVGDAERLPGAVGRDNYLDLRSRVLLAREPHAPYNAMRTRVTTDRLAAAAAQDGSETAAWTFRQDFEAILFDAASQDWPKPRAIVMAGFDLPGLPAVRRRRGRATFPREATAQALELIGRYDPDYLDVLAERLDQVHAETLANLEGRTGLVSVMAERVGERATAWMRQVTAADPSRSDLHGLTVGSGLIFAFAHDHPGARQLRDEIADAAWSDAAMADIVCVALMNDHQVWLEDRIQAEAMATGPLHRVRSLLWRGWRASAEDGDALAPEESDTAFEAQAKKVALARLARKERARAGLEQVCSAADDASAWVGYRHLCQAADCRVWVDLHDLERSGMVLSPTRATQLRVLRGDLEKLARRNEGVLEELFAGAAYPKFMAPWDPVPLYRG